MMRCLKAIVNKTLATKAVYLFLFSAMMFSAHAVVAGTLIATWDSNTEPDLEGYRIYYGTEMGNYTEMLDVGDTTRAVVDNLMEGRTYYFVVTAYDFSGNESLPSDVVSAAVDSAGLEIIITDGAFQLAWDPIENAEAYQVYKENDPYFTPTTPIATVSENQYIDQVVTDTAGVGSFYLIRAVSGSDVIYTYDRVGAYNIGLKQGINLVSLPLLPPDSSLSRIIGTQLTGGSFSAVSDRIMLWNGSSYEIAWLLEGTQSALEGKWVTGAGDQESNLPIKPDISFWIDIRNSHVDTLLRIAGAVAPDSNRVIHLIKGVNFIGYSYPIEIPPEESDLREDEVVRGGLSSAGTDRLMQWENGRFKSAWLYLNPNSSWNGLWMNESGSGLSDIRLTPGRGYVLWIKNENPNDIWTFPNPGN
jgi:hypothetical protein